MLCGDLYLYFGASRETPDLRTTVGHLIVESLTQVGLTVEWNGSPDQAVIVRGLNWRKRRIEPDMIAE